MEAGRGTYRLDLLAALDVAGGARVASVAARYDGRSGGGGRQRARGRGGEEGEGEEEVDGGGGAGGEHLELG